MNNDNERPLNAPVEGTQPYPQPQPTPPYQPYQPQANPYQQPVNESFGPQGPAYQPQPGYPQGYAAPPQPKKEYQKGKPRDLIMAIAVGLALFILTDCFIWTGRLGLGFACGALLVMIVTLCYLRPHWRHRSVYSLACVILYGAGCVSLVLSADWITKLLTAMSLPVLYICLLTDGMDLRAWAPGSFRSIGDFCYTRYVLGYGRIDRGMYGLLRQEKKEGSKRSKTVGKALLGLAVALPLAIILALLLAGGDPAFHGMLSSIDFGKAPEKLLSLLLAIPLFIIIFSRLFILQYTHRERREESGKGLDPTVVMFFLLGVCLVYVAYLFSQLAYFFNGFMGFLPEEFTYAEYARKGFFELTAVSVINIIVIILAVALTRKNEGKTALGVKLPCLFLCVFSLVLAATEIAKMKMYMDNYGLTRLRILTTVFTFFLAVVFIALIIRLFARRFPYLKIAMVVGAALMIASSFVGIDRLVAEYNVSAYQSGALSTIDVDTLSGLGDAAVPSLLRLAEDGSDTAAREAKNSLYQRWQSLYERDGNKYYVSYGTFDRKLKPYDYRGYNTVSYQARELLLENTDIYMEYLKPN